MDVLDYYHNDFAQDLSHVAAGSGPGSHISIVTLVPELSGSSRLKRAFQTIHGEPRHFLFCYFFTVLIDQAIHSGLRQEHPHFDRLAQYPKLKGILGSAHHNLHPGLLLMAATRHTSEGQREQSLIEFKVLSDYFIADYRQFFREQYPAQTGRLSFREDQDAAFRIVLEQIQAALVPEQIPRWFSRFRCDADQTVLHDQWLEALRNRINQALGPGPLLTGS